MIFGILKAGVISLILIFLAHQLLTYLKNTFVDTSGQDTVLRDAKKMYEDMAKTLSRQTERAGSGTYVPSYPSVVAGDDTYTSTTPLTALSNIPQAQAQSVPVVPVSEMESELTSYMRTLSQ